MSTRPSYLALSALVVGSVFIACGSSNTNDLFGRGGSPSGDGGSADVPEGTDGAAADGPSENDGAPSDAPADGVAVDAKGGDSAPPKSCTELTDDVDSLRPQAIECIPALLSQQCNEKIADVCCDATVNRTALGTKAVRDFEAAVAAFKSARCQASCTAINCQAPTHQCDVSGIGGLCAQ